MKNVCAACKYSKEKGQNYYCVKYGIIIYQPRAYCISYEEDSREVRKPKDGS